MDLSGGASPEPLDCTLRINGFDDIVDPSVGLMVTHLKAGYQLVSDGPVCMHGLASLMPYYNALRVSEPAQWGLDGKEDKSKAYIQCPDPFDCTSGGTVIFEISKQ